jgi:hypothetical protein
MCDLAVLAELRDESWRLNARQLAFASPDEASFRSRTPDSGERAPLCP